MHQAYHALPLSLLFLSSGNSESWSFEEIPLARHQGTQGHPRLGDLLEGITELGHDYTTEGSRAKSVKGKIPMVNRGSRTQAPKVLPLLGVAALTGNPSTFVRQLITACNSSFLLASVGTALVHVTHMHTHMCTHTPKNELETHRQTSCISKVFNLFIV